MNNSPEEKLLTGPEFLPTSDIYPKLSAKDFMKLTPENELRNIFGITPEEELKLHENLDNGDNFNLNKKETEKPKIDLLNTIRTGKISRSVLKLLIKLLMLIILIIVTLYLWGGILLA